MSNQPKSQREMTRLQELQKRAMGKSPSCPTLLKCPADERPGHAARQDGAASAAPKH